MGPTFRSAEQHGLVIACGHPPRIGDATTYAGRQASGSHQPAAPPQRLPRRCCLSSARGWGDRPALGSRLPLLMSPPSSSIRRRSSGASPFP